MVVIARRRQRDARPARRRRDLRRAGERRSAPAMRCGASPSALRDPGPVLVIARRRAADQGRDPPAAPGGTCVERRAPARCSSASRPIRRAWAESSATLPAMSCASSRRRDLPPGEPVPMECNAGVYVFDGAQLWPALDRLSTRQRPGRVLPHRRRRAPDRPGRGAWSRPIPTRSSGSTIAASSPPPRRCSAAGPSMRSCSPGVTFEDPATTYVDAEVVVGRDSVIHADDHAPRRHHARRRLRDRPDGGAHRRPGGRSGGHRPSHLERVRTRRRRPGRLLLPGPSEYRARVRGRVGDACRGQEQHRGRRNPHQPLLVRARQRRG